MTESDDCLLIGLFGSRPHEKTGLLVPEHKIKESEGPVLLAEEDVRRSRKSFSLSRHSRERVMKFEGCSPSP